MCAFNARTQEVEASGSLNSRPSWSTELAILLSHMCFFSSDMGCGAMMEYFSTYNQSNAVIHSESFLSAESCTLDGYTLGNCGSEARATEWDPALKRELWNVFSNLHKTLCSLLSLPLTLALSALLSSCYTVPSRTFVQVMDTSYEGDTELTVFLVLILPWTFLVWMVDTCIKYFILKT